MLCTAGISFSRILPPERIWKNRRFPKIFVLNLPKVQIKVVSIFKNTSHAQQYGFFTRPDVRTGLLWMIPLKRAFMDHNSPFCKRGAVVSLIPLNWETVLNEGTQGAIPYNLLLTNLLISLLPAPQLDVRRTILKGLKV